ncbi:hypothetical protein Tco_0856557 [Tanacetum coccineum]|uniref:Pre-mRNA splicing Prp18-interacting factor n=1 Tax=Tanacetum coccineum TaxID=301880 RepID=A0ABQ5B3T7_9ASTR
MSSYNGLGCYLCGDPLDGILCRRCSCGWCGNKLNDGFCSYCASKAGNSFAYDPNLNSFDNSPNYSDYSPQPRYETNICELCGNDAHFGYDCSFQVPFPDPCFDQNFDNNFPLTSLNFPQQYLCCENCGGPHETFQCQPLNQIFYEPNFCYNSNPSGFDQFQPPQFPVNHQPHCEINPKELVEKYIAMLKTVLKHKVQTYMGKSLEILLAEGRLNKLIDTLQRKQCFSDDMLDLLPQIEEDIKTLNDDLEHKEQVAKISILRKFPVYDDDDDDTILATESDEVIKSSVENLVPIPRELEGIPDKLCDIPTCDNDRINVESELVESLINRNTLIVYSSKIYPFLEEFAGELARIALIPPGIVEADFDLNDDTSSDDDSFEDIEYVDASPPDSEIVSLEEVNDDQEEKEFDLENIFQIQDVILREKLLNINCLISNIESLKDNPTPDCVLNSPSSFPIPIVDSDSFFEESDTSLSYLDNSLPEFETSNDHTEETRSGSTTTHVNYSLPGYDSFLFEIEPNQGRLISIAISNNSTNDPLLELPEFESFHFDPSFLRPPPEPPDVEICLHFEPDAPVIDNFNEDQRGSEIDFSQNVEDDDSFTFVIRTFLPFLTYPEVSPLSCSTGSEDTIFDPDIST